jgi:hypothetical protein
MWSFIKICLICIIGITLNFWRFWPIMQIRKKGGWNLKKISSSETTVPISTKLAEMILGWPPSKIVSVDPDFLPCSCSSNFSSFWLTLKQQWTIKISSPHFSKPGRDGPWVGLFQNCVRQPRPPFKMAAVTKNINFFKWPKLLYFKPECAQIWTV